MVGATLATGAVAYMILLDIFTIAKLPKNTATLCEKVKSHRVSSLDWTLNPGIRGLSRTILSRFRFRDALKISII